MFNFFVFHVTTEYIFQNIVVMCIQNSSNCNKIPNTTAAKIATNDIRYTTLAVTKLITALTKCVNIIVYKQNLNLTIMIHILGPCHVRDTDGLSQKPRSSEAHAWQYTYQDILNGICYVHLCVIFDKKFLKCCRLKQVGIISANQKTAKIARTIKIDKKITLFVK